MADDAVTPLDELDVGRRGAAGWGRTRGWRGSLTFSLYH